VFGCSAGAFDHVSVLLVEQSDEIINDMAYIAIHTVEKILPSIIFLHNAPRAITLNIVQLGKNKT
jgi:hypothetical protein